MREEEQPILIYWDASAVLSALIKDKHSREAHQWVQRSGFHFLSTLSYSEVLAVLFRIRRERVMPEVLSEAAEEALERGPWRHLNAVPPWDMLRKLSGKYPLRGADLWHLAAAKSLQLELPELRLLTFDQRLRTAARGEKINL